MLVFCPHHDTISACYRGTVISTVLIQNINRLQNIYNLMAQVMSPKLKHNWRVVVFNTSVNMIIYYKLRLFQSMGCIAIGLLGARAQSRVAAVPNGIIARASVHSLVVNLAKVQTKKHKTATRNTVQVSWWNLQKYIVS